MTEELPKPYHPTSQTALDHELNFVEQRWDHLVGRRGWQGEEAAFSRDKLRGLALSGGGIRSASFCMGVVQQLQQSGVLDRLHYMSTVSGGGYMGASMSWFLSRPPDPEGRRFGTELGNFPFTGGMAAAVRNSTPGAAMPTLAKERAISAGPAGQPKAKSSEAIAGSEANAVANSVKDDTVEDARPPLEGRTVLDYIRQRSSYLNPGAGFTVVSAAAIVLRSVLTSLIGFTLIGAILMTVTMSLGQAFRGLFPSLDLNLPVTFGFALLALFVLGVTYYSLATGVPQRQLQAYKGRRRYQRWSGLLLGAALACFAVALLEMMILYLAHDGLPFPGTDDRPAYGVISSALGTLSGLVVHQSRGAKPGIGNRLLIAILPPLALFLLLTGIGVLAHFAAQQIVGHPVKALLLLLVTLIYCLFSNINLSGLHRFYRDRLMETFMPDPSSIPLDEAAAMTSADAFPLSQICALDTDGPYHLINAHVVLLGAERARFRSRTGDSFVMSRLYCGSEATGYVDTKSWQGGAAILGARPVGAMQLPTAMAISGAALNPRAGADGQGATKGGAISAVLNLLNLRLGFWVPSPARWADAWRPSYHVPPNFVLPGLIQGLFGFAHDERAHWLELSDGGHFENTGIYELVRRGVRTIVFADGSTDPDIAMQSFSNALEKIYIDFNVRVAFEDQDAHFTNLMKGMGEPRDLIAERLEFAKAGFAVGRIIYPKVNGVEPERGWLIYIKSTMVRELPVSLYSYKAVNALFPSETLADQFFSEQQFEAYRALGFALTLSFVQKFADKPEWKQALGFPPPPAPAPPAPPPPARRGVFRRK